MNRYDLIALCFICSFVLSLFCIIETGERVKTECVTKVSIAKQNLTVDEISKLCGVGK